MKRWAYIATLLLTTQAGWAATQPVKILEYATLQSAQSLSEQAENYGLTVEEWQHYSDLMQGHAKYRYTGVEPLRVLGYYAKDDHERQYYAEKIAHHEFERVTQELALNQAYKIAFQELYPNERVIDDFDTLPFGPKQKHSGLRSGDRVVFLTTLEGSHNKAYLGKLLSYLDQSNQIGLDIYIMNKQTKDAAIQTWGHQHGIPIDAVNAGRITLNHEHPEFIKSKTPFPQVWVLRAHTLHPMKGI